MNDQPLLEIQDLFYAYQEDHPVLMGINAAFFSGERVAILGENGAGKSTFFLCLNGVLTPDAGKIILCREEIHKKNRSLLRQKVGIVFQEAEDQIIAPTVQTEVSFGPINLNLSQEEVKRRTAMALSAMHLSGMEKRPTHYLSGGEKKRVTIADILAMESEVLLFDEPTTSLDFPNKQVLEATLHQFWQQGKILVVSTHDVDFAYRFATRILVFQGGTILADGTPDEIFAQDFVLQKAGIGKPMLWEVTKTLKDKQILSQKTIWPKTVEELENLLNQRREHDEK